FTNGKGATKESALASALGEFIERLNCNFFYNDQYWGPELANADFVHYPEERCFQPGPDGELREEILDEHCLAISTPEGEPRGTPRRVTSSGHVARGFCWPPHVRRPAGGVVWFLSNRRENLCVSHGTAACNTRAAAQGQCLLEIFDRAVRRVIIG